MEAHTYDGWRSIETVQQLGLCIVIRRQVKFL